MDDYSVVVELPSSRYFVTLQPILNMDLFLTKFQEKFNNSKSPKNQAEFEHIFNIFKLTALYNPKIVYLSKKKWEPRLVFSITFSCIDDYDEFIKACYNYSF